MRGNCRELLRCGVGMKNQIPHQRTVRNDKAWGLSVRNVRQGQEAPEDIGSY